MPNGEFEDREPVKKALTKDSFNPEEKIEI